MFLLKRGSLQSSVILESIGHQNAFVTTIKLYQKLDSYQHTKKNEEKETFFFLVHDTSGFSNYIQ